MNRRCGSGSSDVQSASASMPSTRPSPSSRQGLPGSRRRGGHIERGV
jgi:hypothetical protein